jgi:hypothetical protein
MQVMLGKPSVTEQLNLSRTCRLAQTGKNELQKKKKKKKKKKKM